MSVMRKPLSACALTCAGRSRSTCHSTLPPHPSSLSVFSRRLLEDGRERYAFNCLVQVGQAAGFLPDKITLLIDTTPQRGAGAVQDTYSLIRKGIREVLRAAGYTVAQKRRGLAAKLAAYLDSDRKASIDWVVHGVGQEPNLWVIRCLI